MSERPGAPAAEAMARAARLLPGGSLGTYLMPEGYESPASRGLGSRLWTQDGREYVDYVLGSGPLILGHAHPRVVEAVTTQAALGTHFYWLNEPALSLAETIVQAVPCAEMVKFAGTGGEATFYALRLARAYSGREKIVRFAGAYHGNHDYGLSAPSAGVPEAVRELTLTAPFNQLDAVREHFDRQGEEIAAVIVEPLQRMTSARPGFLAGLRDLTRRHGALLIFDEVVTGFRLAWGGAQERYGVVPDLVALAKVIGGGLPMAAVAGPERILRLADPRQQPDRYVYFSGTLNGNPLAAAAGLATLGELARPGSYERLEAAGERLRAGLARIGERLPRRLQVLGEGPLAGLAFTDSDRYDPEVVSGSDRVLLMKLERELFAAGLFVNVRGAAGKLYLSFAHSDADLDYALEVFDEALDRVCSESGGR